MDIIWKSPGGTYCYGRHQNGVEAWFVKSYPEGWQQLYGELPPSNVVMAWVHDLRAALIGGAA